jgi:hypothetical protein
MMANNNPFLKVLDSQHKAANAGTRAAIEKETSAHAEFLAASEARDRAAKALQEARHEHRLQVSNANGLKGLKKLLSSGDLEIIGAVLGRPKGPPMGDLGQRCTDAKYASGVFRGHGLREWNTTARDIQHAYAALVESGHLPALPELLEQLKHPKEAK